MMIHPKLGRAVRRLPFAVATLLPIAATLPAAAQADGGAYTITLPTKDGPRRALVVPAGPGPRVTVFALHGGGGSPTQIARTSGFTEAGRAAGVTLVYPEGIGGNWNDGREMSTADDVGFLTALAGEVTKRGLAQPGRIHVTGISNGGMMTLKLACSASATFAGFASVIGSMPTETGADCRPQKPVPMLLMNGTADPLVPYEGGSVGFLGQRGEVWSTDRTMAFFARHNRCGVPVAQALPDRDTSDGSTVTRIIWNQCLAPTQLYRVENGGHQIPGTPLKRNGLTGPANQDIDGAAAIIAFFRNLG